MLLFGTVFISSCDKFVDEPYDNRVLLESVEELEGVVINAYPMRADLFTEILTDNFHHYATTMQASMAPIYVPMYLWRDDYDESNTIATPTGAYAHYYKKIYEANIVIENVNEVTGSELKKKALLGEALMLRAYNYFALVNLFGMHYDEAKNSTNLGVPLVLEVSKENRALYDRSTVKQVYDQIDKDMADGLALLKEASSLLPRTPYRFNLSSIYAFYSRVNLYKGKWDEVVKYADLIIAEKGKIVRKLSEDINRKRTTSETYFAQEIMNPSIHPNLLLVNQSGVFLSRPFGFRLGGFYLAHDIFYKTPSTDLRGQLYSSGGTVIDSVALVVKYGQQPNNPNAGQARYDCFTMEEVLLNRAEALLKVASPNIAAAINDIEAIRKERISPYTALTVPTTVDEALKLVLAERKLELLGQGFRWFDIKRLGIQVEHRLVRTSAQPDEVLKPNDLRTALQIPVTAVIGNPLLENQLNPR